MRLERTSRRATGNRVQHRRFDFEEVAGVEELADRLHDFERSLKMRRLSSFDTKSR